MFITTVSSFSLAVFTNLSVMELDSTKLTLVRDVAPQVPASAAPAAVSKPDQDAQAATQPVQDTGNQGEATASVWARDAVEQHGLRD